LYPDPEDLNGSDDDFVDFIKEVSQNLKKKLLKSVDTIEAGWNNDHGMFNKFTIDNVVILLTGDSSWGDSIDTIEDMNLMELCGAANAAGFRGNDEHRN
jgi:hypothetical protein